jgi:shikimate dehydrogenase
VTEIHGSTTLVGLLGWPVSHSLSPVMHNAAFSALGLDWAYVPLPTEPQRLADAVRGLGAAGFRGANVTIPHKRAVVDLCDELEPAVKRSRSANTLLFVDGRVLGSSTDGLAVTSQIAVAGRRCLILGAGGSAAAVAEALNEAGAAQVRLSSRRDPDWPPSGDEFDVLVNATPLKEKVPVKPRRHQQVVDLAYLPDARPTALVSAARAAGCEQIVDGLDVLLAQGAASLERWTGQPAPLEAMRRALRA